MWKGSSVSTQRSIINLLLSKIAACYLLVAMCVLLTAAIASHYVAEKRQQEEVSILRTYVSQIIAFDHLSVADRSNLILQYLANKRSFFSGAELMPENSASTLTWGDNVGVPIELDLPGFQLRVTLLPTAIISNQVLKESGWFIIALALQLLLLFGLLKILMRRKLSASVNRVVRDLSGIDCNNPVPIQLEASLSQITEYREVMSSVNRLVISLRSSREELIAMGSEADARIKSKMAALEEKNRTLIELNQKLSKLANTDALTQVYNRTRFDELFAEYVLLSKRRHERLSVLLIDLDDFKRVNDVHGHQIGDHVLQHAAQCIKQVIGSEGLVARWGGEEFAVILPYYDIVLAEGMAERVRATLASSRFEKEAIHVTTSIGVAELDDDDTCDELLKRADDALYNAKGEGRNRVILAYSPASRQFEIEALDDGEFIEVFDAEPEPNRCE